MPLREPRYGMIMSIETTDQITSTLNSDLQALTRMIAEMGGIAEKQIVEAVDALSTRDPERAKRVIAGDAILDARQRKIEERAVATIDQWHPQTVDLREIIGALRIANDLERIGDLAKNIGKRVIVLNGENMPRRAIRGVVHMTSLSLRLLKDSLDSYISRDSQKATSVWSCDEEVDSMYVSLFRELLTFMMEDPGMAAQGLHWLFCAKNIERIGDHATSIAEATYYITEGRHADIRSESDWRHVALVPASNY
jgi:phosphate transport system protein